MQARLRIGIDVGGTFTDLYALDQETGQAYTHKVSSTPADPHRAPILGLRELIAKIGLRGADVAFLGLGTTVATNAFLEGKGAPTGLITTRGFRDLMEIGRQTRPHLYDPFARKPAPIVPRHLRCEATERIAADGSVVTALDEAEVREAAALLKARGVQSVAICFLNSYANDGHERRAKQIINQAWPQADVVTSSEVVPEFREYERFVSAVINAYLMPGVRGYFREFAAAVADAGVAAPPLVMSSSGGVFTPELAGARPIDTLFSGPSGGVSSCVFIAQTAGHPDIVTFDMGGTSTEVCLVRNGTPHLSHKRLLKGFPIRTTSHDIHTIGAGGSSIACLDDGGLLQVGPQSAGADPGPACYATGGRYATVTDANVALGRLNQEYLLGGALKIDAAKSRAAIGRDVASPKGIGVEQAALSIVALAEANMGQAIRVVSVERGIDPADFMLLAIGGAGPLHAAAIAREVGMAGVLVPPHPGVSCAMGVLAKDIQLNFSRTRIVRGSRPDSCEVLDQALVEMETAARLELAKQTADLGRVRFERAAAMRYLGQNHEIDVLLPEGKFDPAALAQAANRFHDAHQELQGYAARGNEVEFVTLRITGIVPVERPRTAQAPAGRPPGRPVGERRVLFADGTPVSCPIYARADLARGQVIDGPALIEQMDTTTVVPPHTRATVDAYLNLLITWPQ